MPGGGTAWLQVKLNRAQRQYSVARLKRLPPKSIRLVMAQSVLIKLSENLPFFSHCKENAVLVIGL